MTLATLRMRKMWGIITLTTGNGALTLSERVARIEMSLSLANSTRTEGAAAFWKRALPGVKYNNPTVPISLIRFKDPDRTSKLTVHYRTDGPGGDTTKELVLNNQTYDQVLMSFKSATDARQIPISDEDADRLRWFEKLRQIQADTKLNMSRSEAAKAPKLTLDLGAGVL